MTARDQGQVTLPHWHWITVVSAVGGSAGTSLCDGEKWERCQLKGSGVDVGLGRALPIASPPIFFQL